MEEVTPLAVITSPSSTILLSTTEQNLLSSSKAFLCVVAFFPFKKPAAPRSKEPVHTETFSLQFFPVLSQFMNFLFLISFLEPYPPGTKSMSYSPRSGDIFVGVKRSPVPSCTSLDIAEISHSMFFKRVSGS